MIDENTVKNALKILESEGYAVKTVGSEFWIDLRSKGAIHRYTSQGMGEHWSMIHLKKNQKGEYTAEGDGYSIRPVYDKAVSDLTSAYKQGSIIQAFKMAGFKNPVRKMEKEKIKISAKKW